jgi:hypothetical protein
MADEQFVFELGERPSARQVNDALLELGTAAVKQYVIELLQSGLTRRTSKRDPAERNSSSV